MSEAGVAFEHKGTIFHLKPTAFSTDVIDAVERIYDLEMREKLKENASILASAKSPQEQGMMREILGIYSGRLEKFQYQVQRTRGLATVISMCAEPEMSYDEALEIVREHPNVGQLTATVVEATGINESGN